MTRRTVWSSLLAVASILGCVGIAPCAAQTPAPSQAMSTRPPATRQRTAESQASPESPATDRFPGPSHPPSQATLPSAVAPEIEKFVRESGRDVSPPAVSLPVEPRTIQPGRSSSSTLAPPPAINARGGRGVDDLPRALPPLLTNRLRPPAGEGPSPPGTSPLFDGLKLKSAPFAPTDRRFPITLAAALRLADARPLVVAAAQARVWVAEAELTRAKLLLVPALNIGFDYIRHDGGGPDFNKGIMTAPSVNFFYGGAALWGVLPSTDALFEPLVARRT